jgi:hypothetical protein
MSYERDHRDILDLQNDVARNIAESIRLKVDPAVVVSPARARPLDPEAHQAYLLARYRWYTRRSDELLRAMADFPRAISLDPGYALAAVYEERSFIMQFLKVLPLLDGLRQDRRFVGMLRPVALA